MPLEKIKSFLWFHYGVSLLVSVPLNNYKVLYMECVIQINLLPHRKSPLFLKYNILKNINSSSHFVPDSLSWPEQKSHSLLTHYYSKEFEMF